MTQLKHETNTGEKELAARVGFAALAMATHPYYAGFQYASLVDWIRPPILHRQIRFFFDDNGKPVGFIAWAMINERTEQHLLDDAQYQLHVSEWNEGPIVWITDVCVLPRHYRQAFRLLQRDAFSRYPLIKFAIRDKAGDLIKVKTWRNDKTKATQWDWRYPGALVAAN